jgi:hypothetical protein
VGDTVVVRTVEGSVWGGTARLVPEVSIGVLEGDSTEMFGSIRSLAVDSAGRIYVMDGQVPALRVYGPDGAYLRTLGREGEGPGEYAGPDGGLAVLSDGRVVLRDPANARFTVYGPEGEHRASWPWRGGFNTGRKLYRTRDDAVWSLVLMDPSASVFDWVMGVAEIHPDGSPGDTLREPDIRYDPPTISGEREGGASIRSVPFAPEVEWTMSPEGYLVGGSGDRAAVTLFKPEGPLRIEWEADRVPVKPGEASGARDAAVRQMRSQFPGWSWNGPPIPEVKPAFSSLEVDEEGRIWVGLPAPTREEENPVHDPADPDSEPTVWAPTSTRFRVFEPDGRHLGVVEGPPEISRYPTPVFGAEHVWVVVRDELDVPRVVRFRIVPPREPEAG